MLQNCTIMVVCSTHFLGQWGGCNGWCLALTVISLLDYSRYFDKQPGFFVQVGFGRQRWQYHMAVEHGTSHDEHHTYLAFQRTTLHQNCYSCTESILSKLDILWGICIFLCRDIFRINWNPLSEASIDWLARVQKVGYASVGELM